MKNDDQGSSEDKPTEYSFYFVPAEDGDVWGEPIGPEFKGRIFISNPYTAGDNQGENLERSVAPDGQ